MESKKLVLISACLMGDNVRYDGKNSFLDHPILKKWRDEGCLVTVCPEMAGGLPVPRPPCEMDQATGRIGTRDGQDFTAEFHTGAQVALDLVTRYDIRFALMKARSPSCGSTEIYDGTFSGQRVVGSGVTAALLMKQGVEVFDENMIEALVRRVQEYEAISQA